MELENVYRLPQGSLINGDVPEPTIPFHLQNNRFIGGYILQCRSQAFHIMNGGAIHSMNNVTGG